jgi:hypothetical protein
MRSHERDLFLPSYLVAEYTTSENILNKKIRQNMVVHMQVAELVYERHIQMKNLLCPTPCFLLEG